MGALRRRTGGVVRRVAPSVRHAQQRAGRTAFLLRLQAAAELAGATIDVSLAPDVRVGREVRVVLGPATHNVLRLGAGSIVEDRVQIRLRGGTVDGGERIDLRRDVVLDVAGVLRLEGRNPLSYGTVVHCDEDVALEEMAGVAEQVTIADSSHFFTTPDEHFWHNLRTGRVRVGRNTWICPKATLARGADVGSHCIVASGSVVTGVVPDGSLASGVPASVHPLSLPWRSGAV